MYPRKVIEILHIVLVPQCYNIMDERFMHMTIASISACMNRMVVFSDWAISVSYFEGIIHWRVVGVPQ